MTGQRVATIQRRLPRSAPFRRCVTGPCIGSVTPTRVPPKPRQSA